jgi:hypothetical protein
MQQIASGVKDVREAELKTSIEFQEMHGVAITTMQDAIHQRAHVDHGKAFHHCNDEPQKRAYIGHMPLQTEGMVLRLENLTKKMLACLKSSTESDQLDHNSEAIQDHLYLHIPFGSILLIDDRTYHAGHYGTEGKHRFHFVLSPYDWSPWKKALARRRKGNDGGPKAMKQGDKQEDSLQFLIQAARFYAGWNPEKTQGYWDGEKDPKVDTPKLDTKYLDLSKISNQKEYWENRGIFYETIALELMKNGGRKEECIRCIIDN